MPYQTPGIYRIDVFPTPPMELRTGVPAFLGYGTAPELKVVALSLWTQFTEQFGVPLPDGFLATAVRGFFENGGSLCYVVSLDQNLSPVAALRDGLDRIASQTEIDLVCAPDIMRAAAAGSLDEADVNAIKTMQLDLLQYCDNRGDCFAILDSLPSVGTEQVLNQRHDLSGGNGALYYPWIRIPAATGSSSFFSPPCGHVAGVYATCDRRVGVHKAPANEILEGVLDLERNLSDLEQAELNPMSVNCLRAFPGRGIRVWGARTLNPDPAWMYINVRRLFLTVGRWIERHMIGMAFEQNDPSLWTRIERELTSYFDDLFRRGALKGSRAQEGYYVKCNAETNPPEVLEQGKVITEIGLAPALPNEFVVVRIIHGASGVTIAGPNLASTTS